MQDLPDGQIRKEAKPNLILISGRVLARNLSLMGYKLFIHILIFQPCCVSLFITQLMG